MQKKTNQPLKPLSGFSHIRRYWDNKHQTIVAKVLPGEYYVTKHDELLCTLLGSCISTCIRDPINKIGGMNHFLLPLTEKDATSWARNQTNDATRYGNYAMEHLINDILKLGGGVRRNLEVKIFGGGNVIKSMNYCNIGGRNIQFVYRYLCAEKMPVAAEDVGGNKGRVVYYDPLTGKVKLKMLSDTGVKEIEKEEEHYISDIEQKPVDGDVELF